jgi:hypothetical protein
MNVELVKKVLRQLEWLCDPDSAWSPYTCTLCYRDERVGHEKNCELAKALEELGETVKYKK